MQLNLAERIVDACQDVGIEATIRENYSGRVMFGKTTAGVVVESLTSAMAAIISCAHLFIENDEEELFDYPEPIFSPTGFSTDSMGHDTIIY